MNIRTSGRAGKLTASLNATTATRFFDGGEGGNQIDANDPAVKALIDQAVANATQGLVANRDEILREKRDLQQKLQELSKQWEGLDPNVVKSLVQRFKDDEEAKLIAEGKIDEVISRRVAAMEKDFQTKLKAAQDKIQELESGVKTREERIRDLVIEGSIRQAAAELNLHPSAFEDAIFRAKGQFALDENGKPVARDANGALLMGRNGKDPLSVGEWLESMKEKAPHWFPAPSGAGAAGGGRGGRPGAFVISREEARNPQKYQAAKAAAEKAGQTLQIVED